MRSSILLRTALSLVLAGTAYIASAVTYHVSPSGNDANNGTTPATAWRTIGRVQQHMQQIEPGDQILFQRGGVYPGTLNIGRSGTQAQPIVIGAYGTGDKPVISGGVPVTGWVQHQGNIWRAPFTGNPKYVLVNNSAMTLARHPNSGWMRNVQGSTSTINAGSALNQPNGHWNGAQVVVRTTNYSYETSTVNGFSNGTLSFDPLYVDLQNNDWGFFLMGKLAALDMAGEWFHDAAAGQLYLWAPDNADPNDLFVEACIHANGMVPGWQRQHIRIQDLTFQGQTAAGVSTEVAQHVTVTGCTFRFLYKAISSSGGNNNYLNNTIHRTFATAVSVYSEPNTVVEGNVLTDICVDPGLGENYWGYMGIRVGGANAVVRNNRLTNVGYIGIAVEGSTLVERNVVRHATSILNDGAGIAFDHADGLIIRENIVEVLDCDLTSVATSHNVYYRIGFGIYFGNTSIRNTTVERNTVTRCDGAGIHVDHTWVSSGNIIRDNVLFDNAVQLSLSDYSNPLGPGAQPPYHVPQFDGVYTGNVLFSIRPEQLTMRHFYVYGVNPVNFGTFANNRYFSPYEELSIYTWNQFAGRRDYYTLEQWQTARGTDVGSTRSDLRLTPFEVNTVQGGNMIPNGSFDTNVNGWTGWPTETTITRDLTYLDNGALKLDFQNNNSYDVHFLHPTGMGDVITGEMYRLRFSIQSGQSGQLDAEVKGQSQMTGPYAMYQKRIPFGPERRDISLFFQSDRSEPVRTQFINHYTNPTYWLDNVALERVQVTPADPLERFQLVYNEHGTTQTFALDGCWSDVDGNFYSGSVEMAPFRSLVLQKEEDMTCSLTTGLEELTHHQASPGLYPNPARAGEPIRLMEPVNDQTLVELVDMMGRTVQQASMPAGSDLIPVGQDVPAGSYLVLLREPMRQRTLRLVLDGQP